ncbi:WxL domain-containing protein [Cryobacterium arcticum]|uniref:WxL domain-containing protein n=1 Tax=Cryobacterium arcticum TaxID=670052 RepID=A0A1B1BL25_9MICO|nr:WxL domain-containing protein [Cryobacterium arcticum]ANP73332.1 hypothetical protein PA27867_2382 [Cryobacterium arcticum]
MKLSRKTSFAAAGLMSLALVATAATAAQAAPQSNGSDGPMYIYDGTTAEIIPADAPFAWDEAAVSSNSPTDPSDPLFCPVGSEGAVQFLSAPGEERNPLNWMAYSPGGFDPSLDLSVLLAPMMPEGLYNGLPGQAAVKAAGGTYSLGVACTIYNDVKVVGAFYRTITVEAGTGIWRAAAVQDTTTPVDPTDPTDPGTPADSTGTIALAPTVVGATNGVLALTVPAGAAATFGTPTLVNNKSTTTGTLGAVTVNDGRVLTLNGWDLTANVADFVNAADTTSIIGKAQLGLAPQVTTAGTTATGVTAAAAQVAGSASYPAAFASAAAGSTVGASVLDAGLTFVAPQSKAAGTYNSTLTLTVVSK